MQASVSIDLLTDDSEKSNFAFLGHGTFEVFPEQKQNKSKTETCQNICLNSQFSKQKLELEP